VIYVTLQREIVQVAYDIPKRYRENVTKNWEALKTNQEARFLVSPNGRILLAQ